MWILLRSSFAGLLSAHEYKMAAAIAVQARVPI